MDFLRVSVHQNRVFVTFRGDRFIGVAAFVPATIRSLRGRTCVGIETGRRKRTPLDECVPTIGYFYDCKVWSETVASSAIRYVFFGLPADVEAAQYLYDNPESPGLSDLAPSTVPLSLRITDRLRQQNLVVVTQP